MRQQGEGIPRIIEDMVLSWLPAPDFNVQHGLVRVVLCNGPIFEATDEHCVNFVRELPLHVRQRRALVAFHDRTFQSGDYQELNRGNRDVAYRELQELQDRGLVQCEGSTKARRYEVRKQVSEQEAMASTPMDRLKARMAASGRVPNADFREIFGVERVPAAEQLAALVAEGQLEERGERPGAHNVPGPKWKS